MSSPLPLAGKRIAVLVESQYIPGEIKIYQERFAGYGATVDLVSRLWGQPKLRFYSTVEPEGENVPPIEWLEVSIDIDDIEPDDYAAVIMTANYTSVRLRFNEAPSNASTAAEVARSAPPVRFVRRVMQNPKIIKGAPCHALWLLTPSPDILASRKVICNPVVLADVVNAGAVYTPCPAGTPEEKQVIVDRDLVTNASWKASEALVDAIKDLIVSAPTQSQQELPLTTVATSETRRILIAVSEWGYWGEELVGPLGEFDRADYIVDFCTPTGKRPNAIPVSMDPDFFDPPLQRPVTSPEMAARVREIDDPATVQGKRLQNPINLADWFPERPYFAAPAFVRQLEAYNRALGQAVREVDKYDAILIVGGSGALVDLANNQRVHDLILAFLRAGKPVAAECYGVGCLAFARDMNERTSIIRGQECHWPLPGIRLQKWNGVC